LYVNNVRGQAGHFTLTVDSFQGQERDIFAIILTRSNPQGEIGFLSNIRRMNVGMTRVKSQAVAGGDWSMFCRRSILVDLFALDDAFG
jgi:superfamily I DNA and/or RNA helicase